VRRVVKALSREGLDTFRSLVGLATAPAIWAALTDRVTIVSVPADGITTTDFNITAEGAAPTVKRARDACASQLRQAREGATVYQANREDFLTVLPQFPASPAWLDLVPTYSLEPKTTEDAR
jgi:hypothetical protein